MSATPEEELDTSQEEPFVIELTEDDVQTVLNSVKIIEERFNEDAEIRLNEDQLLIELTNLFYTDIADLENNRNLSKKNKRFLDLIAEAAGEKAPAPPLKDLKPIINAVRVILLTEDDEEIDPEYEEDNQVKMMFQSEYLRRFQEIANNKSQTVDQVLPQLYLWTRSWRGADGPSKGFKLKIGKAIDAIIAAGGEAARTRLTGATPPYFDGDECDVVGVVIESPSAVRKPTQERYRFSITEYFAALESFAVGDNVSVCLNDFFEDVGGLGDRCTHQARVIRVVPGQGLYIDAHRVAEIFVPYRKYCPVMIFRDNRNHFNKRDFHQHDVIEIIFDPTVPLAENVAFARPISASEALFMNFHLARERDCYTFAQVEKLCLAPYGYTMRDIDYVSLAKLKQILSMKSAILAPSQAHVADNDRPRRALPDILKTIKSWQTYCDQKREHLGAFSRRIERHEARITQEIQDLQTQLANSKSHCSGDAIVDVGSVAMRLEFPSMLSDSPADLFFAPSHDPTDYKIAEIIRRDYPRISDADLEARVRQEVASKYPKLKKSELDFEVKSILRGRRKIRIGDFAAIAGTDGMSDIVYKLTSIESRPMWIKVFKVPFKSCDADIIARARQDLDTDPTKQCVYDTYSKLCKSLEDARISYRISVLNSQLECLRDIHAFIDSPDIPASVVAYFEDLAAAEASGRPRHEIAILEGVTIDDDLDRYFGDIEYVDADAMFANPDAFGDAFAPLPQQRASERDDRAGTLAIDMPNAVKIQNAFDNLCEILGLNTTTLGSQAMENIVTTVAIDHPDIPVDKDAFYKAKFKSVNQELYKTKPSYRKGVDDMVAKKYKEEVAKVAGEYYHRVYVHIAAMIALFIMAKYPAVTFNTVLSTCATTLAYSGYPIKDRGDARSIYAYIACVLKTISTPDDERLSALYKTTQDVIRDAIEERAVSILGARPDIATAIEANRDNLATSMKKLAVGPSEHEQLFAGFKPEAAAFKLNGTKAELTPDIRFDIEDGSVSKQRSRKPPISVSVNTSLYIPVSGPNDSKPEQSEYFEKAAIKHEVDACEPISLPEVKTPESIVERLTALELGIDLPADPTDDQWWDQVIYTGLDSGYDEVMRHLNWDGAATLKGYLITLGDSAVDIVTVMHGFISTKLPMILSRLMHGKYNVAIDDKSAEVIATQMSMDAAPEVITGMRECVDYIARVRDYLLAFTHTQEQGAVLKNKMILVRVFIDVLRIVSMIDRLQYEVIAQGQVKIGSDVARFICQRLLTYLDSNLKKQEDVKKRIEELRERRKTELMGAYKADDEERQLQMTLKAMGLKTWFNVGAEAETDAEAAGVEDEAAGLVAPVPIINMITAEEAENYRMGDYVGMNDEGDADEDLYYQIRED